MTHQGGRDTEQEAPQPQLWNWLCNYMKRLAGPIPFWPKCHPSPQRWERALEVQKGKPQMMSKVTTPLCEREETETDRQGEEVKKDKLGPLCEVGTAPVGGDKVPERDDGEKSG